MNHERRGFGYACALAAQVLWGCFPLYFYFLSGIDSFDLVAHRIVWCFLILMAYFSYRRYRDPSAEEFRTLRACWTDRKLRRTCALAAALIGVNWTVFVWAVTHNRTLDASLGYYLCPQVAVFLGVLVLGERLTGWQWLAVGLAAAGVAVMSRSAEGIPWPALLLATSFGFYALIKKRLRVPALTGVAMESGFLLIPAIAFLAMRTVERGSFPAGETVFENALLVGSGLLTIAPLAFYATALKHIPLSTVGLLQFLAPSLHFLFGVFLTREAVDASRLVGFACVWTGVALYLGIALNRPLRGPRLDRPDPQPPSTGGTR